MVTKDYLDRSLKVLLKDLFRTQVDQFEYERILPQVESHCVLGVTRARVTEISEDTFGVNSGIRPAPRSSVSEIKRTAKALAVYM
jgi:hypothetical protein